MAEKQKIKFFWSTANSDIGCYDLVMTDGHKRYSATLYDYTCDFYSQGRGKKPYGKKKWSYLYSQYIDGQVREDGIYADSLEEAKKMCQQIFTAVLKGEYKLYKEKVEFLQACLDVINDCKKEGKTV